MIGGLAPLKVDSELGRIVEWVGKGEDVSGVGVEAGLDGRRLHGRRLRAFPLNEKDLCPKLRDVCACVCVRLHKMCNIDI